MNNEFSVSQLREDNRRMSGTGGTSHCNRALGFSPAFLDTETGVVLSSVNADGSYANIHRLDGLPERYVISRNEKGGVQSVKASVVAGFTLAGKFFTREQAAQYIRRNDR